MNKQEDHYFFLSTICHWLAAIYYWTFSLLVIASNVVTYRQYHNSLSVFVDTIILFILHYFIMNKFPKYDDFVKKYAVLNKDPSC